ncbi:MAG TPA: NfeD family protein [Acholeplasma sp.]|nr:NfeD family protein [Acholeplasma sp.]
MMTTELINMVLMLVIWSVILIGAIFIELETADLVTIWFAAGAIGGLLAAAFGLHIMVQIAVFIGVSLGLLLITRPLTRRFMQRDIVKTNADKLVGQNVVVVTFIPVEGRGEVKVEERVWTAFTTGKDAIEVGKRVIIQDIVGNKLLVTEVKE